MKKTIILNTAILSLSLLFSSCNYEDTIGKQENSSSIVSIDVKKDTQLKEKFAFALSKALHDSPELREFLKIEALKKITKDYDVVYHLVKNKSISSPIYRTESEVTLRSLLLPYFENEQELIEIEQMLPLLTIFVPDLQEGSFSALNWNTSTQVPAVAVRSYENDDVKLIEYTGEVYILQAEDMPDFPVVVVKDNERLLSNLTSERYSELSTQILSEPTEAVQFRYSDDNFNPSIVNNIATSATPSAFPRVDQIHADAYNVYSGYTPGGWQRDYIYYGLTPTVLEGGINPSYREHVTSFKLTGTTPTAAYQWITSHQDPHLRNIVFRNRSGWTDGSYEFKIFCNYGAKNSNLGTEEIKQFSADPNELFVVSYVPVSSGWIGHLLKRPVVTGLKTMDFYNNSNVSLEFSVWDLNNFSNQWKLTFEEVETPIEITTSTTQTNKFNTNFSLEPSTGILKKIGLKFGASYEQTQSNTYTTKQTDVSDQLGNSIVDFYGNVVNLNGTILVPRKYNTGKVEFEFRPMQVQF